MSSTLILQTPMKKKYLSHSLTAIYGIGLSKSEMLSKRLGYTKFFIVKTISSDQIFHIHDLMASLKLKLKGDLKRDVTSNIKLLEKLNTYRGFRHRSNLPVRGQRTHTNSRGRKKKKKKI